MTLPPATPLLPARPQVESLTAARKAAVSGAEPSDAVRVVNAVLTAIDSFRARRNVLLLTTSNVSEAIDVAFVDRADIKALVGPPGVGARFDILASCVAELARVGLLAFAGGGRLGTAAEARAAAEAADAAAEAAAAAAEGGGAEGDGGGGASGGGGGGGGGASGAPAAAADVDAAASATLWRTAVLARGLSGRALRKLPLAAHSLHMRRRGSVAGGVPAALFCEALLGAVRAERGARVAFSS